MVDKTIEIEIWNHKKVNLNLNEFAIIYIEKSKDIIVIQMKNSEEEIYKDIHYLSYDWNYIDGYQIYKNAEVFSIKDPFSNEAVSSIGTIININDFEFVYKISTHGDFLGSPILLLKNNRDLIQVIGILKNEGNSNKISRGIFINEILKN